MKFRRLILTAAVLLAAGCASDKAPEVTSSQLGAQTKAQVTQFVTEAKQRPATAPQQAQMLVESLDALAQENAPELVPVRDAAKELAEMYGRRAPKKEIDAQLKKLSDAAESLPSET